MELAVHFPDFTLPGFTYVAIAFLPCGGCPDRRYRVPLRDKVVALRDIRLRRL